MSESISRDIYLFTRRRVPPIDIVYGSVLPIVLNLMDYTIPTGATAAAYATGGETVYEQAATVSGNAVRFSPGYGFFVPGRNELQIAINGNKIPLSIMVNCENQLADISDPESTPETVRPLVDQAREILAETRDVAAKTPYVGTNGNWYVWNTTSGQFVDSGKPSRGATGSKGDKGDKGDQGEQGIQGIQGNKGDQGIQGIQGIQGEKGDTGAAASVLSAVSAFQASASGTQVPTGNWSSTVPTVAQGQFLWTRTTITFNSGNPVVIYSVARMGMDGSGAVSSVNDVSPDASGNVTLTGDDLTVGGQTIADALAAKQARITAVGLLKRSADGSVSAAAAGTDYQAPLTAGVDYATPDALEEKQDAITATGLLKRASGGAISAAVAGTDYATPASVTAKQDKITATGILKRNSSGNVVAATAGTDYATPSAVLAKSGGTMTGAITTKGIVLTSGVDYGDSLPSTVTAGKLFFVRVAT